MPNSSSGKHGRGAGEAGDVARPRRHQAGLGAVRAPQAEIDQHLVRRRQHHPRRFGGDQGLKMQNVDQPRFDQLRLRQRRGDPQDRLIGEEHRALGHGMHVAGEAQRGEIIEQVVPEAAGALEPVDFGRARNAAISRKSSACSNPAATKKPRRAGRLRTKNSKTAVSVSP